MNIDVMDVRIAWKRWLSCPKTE